MDGPTDIVAVVAVLTAARAIVADPARWGALGAAIHRRDRITAPDSPLQQSWRVSRFAADQPARDGRQVRIGFRQSIPSSR